MSHDRSRCRAVPWRQFSNRVSLGRAKADSPSPRNGSQHPVLEVGFGAIPRKLQTRGGEWQDQVNMTVFCIDEAERGFGGCDTGIVQESAIKNRRESRSGMKPRKNYANGFRPGTTTSLKSSARANDCYLRNGRTFSW